MQYYDVISYKRWRTTANTINVMTANLKKWSDYDEIFYAESETILKKHLKKIQIFKFEITVGRHIKDIVFGYFWAADWPIFANFCLRCKIRD